MNDVLTQDKRVGSFSTPLGQDALVLVRFSGQEGLSELFEFVVEALSTQSKLDFDKAIGRNCSVTFKTYGRGERVFNGVLVEAQALGPKHGHYGYRLVLRPWLWLLSHTTDCRIFDKMTVPDIIEEVFSKGGFSDYRLVLTESYPTLEYCVQYRETDLAFVARLMELNGIYYYFEHTADRHQLVLVDSKTSHKPVPGSETLPFIALVGRDRRDREHIYDWLSERRFRSGKVALNDYDYLKPNAKLLCDAEASAEYSRSDMELYDYPGKYTETSDGDRYAKVRLEAEQAQDHRRFPVGDAVSLFPGGLFTLDRHPNGSENIQYLVVRAAHGFVAEAYRSGSDLNPEQIYEGHYEVLPGDRPFRAPPDTPRPLIHGLQTAKVVGKEGEEIDVDEHGRITVQFHWDRDKKPSRRVRVAQIWSGKAWGGQVIPRIGQEVAVEFLEGDPDQPLVVGTVYNKDYKYPYALPANKTISGVKSDSSKGGGGYNELIFEDKKGEEQIGMHAEKDLDIVVRNAETREIGEAFTPPMGQASRSTTLKNGDDELSVDLGNQTVTVAQKISITAGIQIELTVGPSSITINNMGVTISAPTVRVLGAALVQVNAPITEVTGSAVLALQGGLIKLG